MSLTKVHKSKYSVLFSFIYSVYKTELCFSPQNPEERPPIIEPKKKPNYISSENGVLGSLKPLDSLPQLKCPAKENAVSYPPIVWKEKRTKWPLNCVISHNEKLAVVVVTTRKGTICSLWDIKSASFSYNVYTFVIGQHKEKKQPEHIYHCSLTVLWLIRNTVTANVFFIAHVSTVKKSVNVYTVLT